MDSLVDWDRQSRYCIVDSEYNCIWCDDIVEKRRKHIAKKHMLELENEILTKLGDNPSG